MKNNSDAAPAASSGLHDNFRPGEIPAKLLRIPVIYLKFESPESSYPSLTGRA
jgi:hypothetical protein